MYRNSSLPGPSGGGGARRERRAKGWSMWQRGGSAHVTDSGSTVLWLPYCTHRERCTVGDSQDASCRADCLKLVTELNREVSAHHTLALALGGTGDCGQLRDELKHARRRAQEIAKQTRLKLLPCLHDQKLSDRDRPEFERLWYLYCCCVCVLEAEMRRSLCLQRLFSLHSAPSGFIKTGLNELGVCSALHHKPVAAVAAAAAMGGLKPAAEALDVPLADRLAFESAELNQLHKEIAELREVVPELQQQTLLSGLGNLGSMPGENKLGWGSTNDHTDQCIAGHTAAVHCNDSGDSPTSSSNDSLYSDVGSQMDDSGMTLQQRRCVCWVVITLVSVFVMAAVVGVSMALLF